MASRFYVLVACLVQAAAAVGDENPVSFNRDIRPILSDLCFKCHGPDEKTRAGGLRLDTREGAITAADSGKHAIVPGRPEAGELLRRVLSADPDERMPPPAAGGRRVSPEQADLLKRWIAQGAEYRGHWSFEPPSRPATPQASAPHFPVRNPIDALVLARLTREGLTPSKPADKVALIRRLTLDLTGLPPTPAEVDAFLADDSPSAYAEVVERLLASPRFGEHQARYWLDLARYGDTHGLHLDNERALWKYREWVIRAFNDNMPFDRFAVEQLAGDLLPNPTHDQRIATGFNRCNVTTSEGGSINDEVLVRYAVDRTETLGTVFLGLTLGCAVCHDHKFDPVSQKDFYRLYAFYNASADAAMDGNAFAPPPVLRLPTEAQTARLKELDAAVAATRKRIADALAAADYVEPTAKPGECSPREPADYVWIDDAVPAGAKPEGTTPWEFVKAPDHPVLSGRKSMRRSGKGITQHYFEKAATPLKIGPGDKLFAHVRLDPKDPPKAVMLQFHDGTGWEHRAVWGDAKAIEWGEAGTASRWVAGPLPKAGEWVRLEIDADKVGFKPGAAVGGWAFTQFDGTVYWDKAGLVTRTRQGGQGFETIAEWEEFERADAKSKTPKPVRDAVKAKPEKRTDAQKKLIRDHFLEHVYGPTRKVFEPLHKEIESLEKQRKDTDAAVEISMVMADLPKPRDTHVLIRGAYDKKGEKVSAGTPAVLPPMPEGAPANRLGLARWLTARGHPLTARVTVNRFWQQFFGRGLVKTSEDFGSQGEWPSHPDLLDWLATEFVDGGWDVKHLMRLIVTSSTYRQSSDVTPDLLKRDPENVLLARGPRFRLDAEVVRDSALFVSGLLVEKVGGRSVKTYQPPGIWEAVGFLGSNTRQFSRDKGEALYRRSLYTFWKRTAPPPSLMAFDAPSRETCTARRARTNTPLQALALMNDEQYVEAARHFAERMIASGGATPAERLAFGFRAATARRPTASELDVLVRVFGKQLERFRADAAAAGKLLAVGESKRNPALDPAEHAAYTMAANLILNLDETISKE
jgi:hypothetical protein